MPRLPIPDSPALLYTYAMSQLSTNQKLNPSHRDLQIANHRATVFSGWKAFNFASRIFADYPSLGRGIILPQSPQQQSTQQQEQPEPAIDTSGAVAGLAVAMPTEVEIEPPLPAPPVTFAKRPQLPAKPAQQQQQQAARRARPSVLLKPQYACFLQHDDDAPKSQPTAAGRPRKAASFSLGNQRQSKEQQQHHHHYQPQHQQSKYERNDCSRSRGSCESPAPELQQRRRRPSLPSSLALSNASSALLQARIPGTTLYYVWWPPDMKSTRLQTPDNQISR